MIELNNVSKSYNIKKNKVEAVKNVSLKLPNNGMVFLIGKSGSGKSTLLNLLGLLDKVDSGEILFNGKNINKFKNKEKDFYRNTCVGFVFQDFNLLENINVYKNIELAVDLQRKKTSKEELDKILDMVGLSGLGSRKTNELSGGQKQRVAIARAIVKNSRIILADEPTGNLDGENSEQVFQILKQLSNDRLVVVVTHDVELANKYADRIVQLENGVVTQNVMINEKSIEQEDVKLIKSRLSLRKAFLLSISSLKNKKIKLAIMTLLVSVSLAVFGFSFLLTKFDVNKTHAKAMIEQKETRVDIYKTIKGKKNGSHSAATFTGDEVNYITKKLNKDVVKVSKAVENNGYLSIESAGSRPEDANKKSYAYYYGIYSDKAVFLEYSEEKLKNLNLIGNPPLQSNEIVINKIFADYILKKGLLVLGVNEKGETITEKYYPTSYEQLLSDKKKIAFGSTYLTISGIVDTDLSEYDILKETLSDEIYVNPTKLYKKFVSEQQRLFNEIIVSDTFFDTLNLIPNNYLSTDLYTEVFLFEGRKVYPFRGSSAILNKEIKIYDGKKYSYIKKLGNNEIIIGLNTIDELYDYELSTKFKEHVTVISNQYKNKVEEREEKLKEIEKKLLEEPNYQYEIPREIERPDYQKIQEEFIIKYINDKQLIGKTITFQINDRYLRRQETKTKNIGDFIIKGYTDDDIYNYFSEDVLKDYMRENKETSSIYFYEDNEENLEKIFDEYPPKDAKFISETIFTDTVKSVEKVVKKISKIAFYCSIGALVFSFILFVYFVVSSVNSNKKNIGILRGIGARTSDIYKIFYLESFLLGLFAFVISIGTCYYSTIVANDLISKDLFAHMRPIMFRADLILYMFIFITLVVTISFIIPIFKISKTKPIDVINK